MLLVIIRCRLIAGMFEINVLSAYSKQVLIPVLRVLFISSLLPLAVNSGMEEGWLRLFAMTACSIVSVAFAVYVLGLTSGERAFVENRIINIKERLVKMDDKKQRRVGVITWISYFNFGTYLQAYALQTVVRSLGYACSIVSDEKMVRALRKESCWLRKVVSKIYHFLKRDDVCFIYGMRQIEAAYASFKSSYLSVDDDWNSSMDLDQRYDIYVCGSDQIWSPILPKQDYYYAGFTEKKKVAYAPSIGQRDCSEEWSEWVKPLLDRFSHLSVREEEGAALLRRFMDKPVDVVLDPTLLLSSEDWEN